MTNSIAIVVLSDLHAEPSHWFNELSSDDVVKDPTNPNCTTTSLSDSINPFIEKIPVDRRILICPGDISSNCNSRELRKGIQFINTISNALLIPSNHRLLTPGNHEIDWNITSLSDKDPWYVELRQYKFATIVSQTAPLFEYTSNGIPKLIPMISNDVDVLLLDSPHNDLNNTVPHRGCIGAEQLQAMERLSSRFNNRSLRIALFHHHIYATGSSYEPADFSLLQDSRDVLSFLKNNRFDFVIHGHEHRPDWFEILDGERPLRILCSGSTTYENLPPDTRNSCHIIIINEFGLNPVKGYMHSFSHNYKHGWQHIGAGGLEPTLPFGEVIPEGQLISWANEIIDICQQKKFIYLHKYLSTKPNGNSLRLQKFRRKIDFQCNERNINIHWLVDEEKNVLMEISED